MDESGDTHVAITSPLQGKYPMKTLELPVSQQGLALQEASKITVTEMNMRSTRPA